MKVDLQALLERVKEFVNAPNEYQSHLALVIVMLLFLLLLRRQDNRKQGNLQRGATDVLEERYRKGEISEEAYRKARAELALRPKR